MLSVRKFADEYKPTDNRVEQSNLIHMPKALKTRKHIYERNENIKQNLTPINDGSFLVHLRTDKTFKIFCKANFSSVAINNVKRVFALQVATSQLPFVPRQILVIPIFKIFFIILYNLRAAPPAPRDTDLVTYGC